MQPALDLFRALADPSRLRIMALVRSMELSIGELAEVLGQSQPRVSRHVRILAEAGLLVRHKEGAWVFLRIEGAGLAGEVGGLLDRMLDDSAAVVADARRLDEIRARRVAEMHSYFDAHAEGWDGIRSMHVSDGEVEAAILRALAARPVGYLLDIGTGTGRMLELLAPGSQGAVGVDRSADMLRVARGKLEAARLGHCEVRQADMYALPQADGSIDTVLLHQVLHYADNPAAAITEAGRVLAPGGRLLVIDFAPHTLEELRSNHAHTRLGFADEAVLGWMRESGLEGRVVDHLKGGTLTVSIWLGEKAPLAKRKAA
ncbi:ArsR/SmtB family transcription factor [Sphingosinicella xenopeptidilytica]|uniref:ArsR/SmtB family transcription factor n=1 Tax=Sphingosinicella xenopeptidilytica TaxID=364098 RepID=A0ABW3C2Y4_SPHXN